jgi:hypothetical protein
MKSVTIAGRSGIVMAVECILMWRPISLIHLRTSSPKEGHMLKAAEALQFDPDLYTEALDAMSIQHGPDEHSAFLMFSKYKPEATVEGSDIEQTTTDGSEVKITAESEEDSDADDTKSVTTVVHGH